MTSALVHLGGPADAAVHLVALSPAGAGAGTFRPWAPLLPGGIGLWGARLPGRENRIREPHQPIEALARDLAAETAHLPGVVGLFGHSFGALLAYAVAAAAQSAGRVPAWLGVCGIDPARPHTTIDPLAADDAVLAQLAGLGTDTEPQLLRITLPAVRADVAAAHAFLPVRGPALTCPVSVFAGRDDLTREQMLGWRPMAAAELMLRRYPGGHFHLSHDPRPVARDACADLLRAAHTRRVAAT